MKKSKINLSLMLFASAIAGATFIYSCTKDTNLVNPASPNSPVAMNSPTYTPCPNVSNVDNPYDHAGVTHNAGLSYLYEHRPEWACGGAGGFSSGIAQVTTNFLCESGYGQGPDCYGTTLSELTALFDQFDYSDPDQIIDGMGSAVFQAYMDELLNEVYDYEDSTQIDTLLASIKEIETDVIASSMSAEEKETFLGCASVGRYSACYWFQEYQKPLSDWAHCPGGGEPLGKIKWGNIGWTVAADIMGFAVGNVGGAIGFSALMGAHVLTH